MTPRGGGSPGQAPPSEVDGLDARQRELLEAWLPGARVRQDHSWGLVGTRVLELAHGGQHYVAKAGDAADRHIAREITAHQQWLGPWTAAGRAPELVQADVDAKLLLTRYLDGRLVQGTLYEEAAGTYRQAGELLAQLHGQTAVPDADYEQRQNDKALRWLAGRHRVDPEVVARLRREIESWPTPCVDVVPTHGDWHPRNWLVHDGELRAIDLGRAELRPAHTDLARLATQQFRGHPDRERAFLDGYGADPREPEQWRRTLVREAIGTAVWAFQVGDVDFEAQGHRMVADVLAAFDG